MFYIFFSHNSKEIKGLCFSLMMKHMANVMATAGLLANLIGTLTAPKYDGYKHYLFCQIGSGYCVYHTELIMLIVERLFKNKYIYINRLPQIIMQMYIKIPKE